MLYLNFPLVLVSTLGYLKMFYHISALNTKYYSRLYINSQDVLMFIKTTSYYITAQLQCVKLYRGKSFSDFNNNNAVISQTFNKRAIKNVQLCIIDNLFVY